MKIAKIILEPGEQIEIAIAQSGVPEMLLFSAFVYCSNSDNITVITANTIEEFTLAVISDRVKILNNL